MPDIEQFSTTHYYPFGLTVELITNSPRVVALAEQSFGQFSTPTVDDERLKIELYQHDLDVEPTHAPTFHTAGVYVHRSCGRAGTLVANRESGAAFGNFSASVIADAPFFRWHFLEFAVFLMLQARGLMGIHGAAVVRDGRAVILRAASGGGKTTLAYAACRAGWQALAEDVVWLDFRSEFAEQCWGLPWTFHLLPDAKGLFPELATYPPVLQTNQEWKLEVELAQVWPHSTCTRAKQGTVVLVARNAGGTSHLEPISLETAYPLWQAGQVGNEAEFPAYQSRIRTLLTDNAYRLHFGDDIPQAVALLETLVA